MGGGHVKGVTSPRGICVAVLSLLLILVSSSAHAADVNINVTYPPSEKGLPSRATMNYSDRHFYVDSRTYNPELAEMSLLLAMSAFNSMAAPSGGYKAEIAASNVIDVLRAAGFDMTEGNYDCSLYGGQPTKDSIGAIIASKRLDDECNLVVVAIRGGRYENEWVGNFNISSWGHHGFDAYLQVVDKLLKYLGKHEARLQGHIKLWIVGYSRGAAIANLTGAFMANVLAAFERMGEPEGSPVANYVLRPKDLFVYTFATPKTTTKSNHNASKYSSIFNIINPRDLIPQLPPKSVGHYRRYGRDLYVPEHTTKLTEGFRLYHPDWEREYQRITSHKIPSVPLADEVLLDLLPYVVDLVAFSIPQGLESIGALVLLLSGEDPSTVPSGVNWPAFQGLLETMGKKMAASSDKSDNAMMEIALGIMFTKGSAGVVLTRVLLDKLMSTVTAAHYPELYLAGLRYHSFGPRVVAPPPTPAPAPSPSPAPSPPRRDTPQKEALKVVELVEGGFSITIPKNYRLNCYEKPTASTPYTYVSSKPDSYRITATKRAVLSDGSTRYFFISSDEKPKECWFVFTSKMSLEKGTVLIQYNANGGSGAPNSHTVESVGGGITFRLSSVVPTRAGYEFTGWRLENSSDYDIDQPNQVIRMGADAGVLTYYAQWRKKTTDYGTVTIKYNPAGGSGAPLAQTVTKDGQGRVNFQIPAQQPSRQGYVFMGWMIHNDPRHGIQHPKENVALTTSSPTSNEVFEYFAQWATPGEAYGEVTIRYNANEGEGAPPSHSVAKDAQGTVHFSLPEAQPTRNGYNFTGWLLGNDPKNKVVQPGEEVEGQVGKGKEQAVLEYYAQWEKAIVYKLIYDGNGGTGVPRTESSTDPTFVISSTIPTRRDHRFTGWLVGSKRSTQKAMPGDTFEATEETTRLYAEWEWVKPVRERPTQIVKAFWDQRQSDIDYFVVMATVRWTYPIDAVGIRVYNGNGSVILDEEYLHTSGPGEYNFALQALYSVQANGFTKGYLRDRDWFEVRCYVRTDRGEIYEALGSEFFFSTYDSRFKPKYP